ncbi:MAG: glycosyltransferase [Verrucomicrobiales bacterium]
MKFSIIIPAYNEEKLLPNTLPHILRSSEGLKKAGIDLEFILANNNSADRTAAIAAEHGFQVVFEPVNQIGRARNAGASIATGDWLIFIDADSLPSPELFSETLRLIETGKVLAGGSTVKLDEPLIMGAIFVGVWNLLSRFKRWLAGSYIFCDARVFRELGGFSPDLYASEELELSERFKKRAKQVGKRVTIIRRHPLQTSARKAHLYSPGEHLKFLLRVIFKPKRVLSSREACHTWYDGRR